MKKHLAVVGKMVLDFSNEGKTKFIAISRRSTLKWLVVVSGVILAAISWIGYIYFLVAYVF